MLQNISGAHAATWWQKLAADSSSLPSSLCWTDEQIVRLTDRPLDCFSLFLSANLIPKNCGLSPGAEVSVSLLSDLT